MKPVLLKAAILAALVLPTQAVIGLSLNRAPLAARDALDRHGAARATLVVFGDSVARSVAATDADRRSLNEMLRDRLSGERVEWSQSDAGSLELYEASLRYLARLEHRPARVVIPINLRSFSKEWDPRPEYQFRVDRLRLAYGDVAALGFMKPLSVWKVYPLNPVTRSEYLGMPVEARGRRIGTVRDLLEAGSAPGMERLESQFAFRYLYTLDPGHRKVQAMVRAVEVCRGAGMEPLFCVYPVDASSGELAAGSGFREQIASNVATLRRRLDAMGARMLDLSLAVDSSRFDWKPGLPNEHLNEAGRRQVVDALAEFLKR